MIEQIEINNSGSVEDEYVDLISYKTIDEMQQPVITPQTGHIYDQEDIINWINRHGTDPVDRDNQLTANMLVPGRFVKQINGSNIRMINDLRKKLQEANLEKEGIKKENIYLKVDLEDLADEKKTLENDLSTKEAELAEILDECSSLRKENKQLRRDNKNSNQKPNNDPILRKYGKGIQEKLKKGSHPERTRILNDYYEKAKACVSDDELKKVINDDKRLRRIREPRFFGCFVGESESYRVAIQFQEDINKFKGW